MSTLLVLCICCGCACGMGSLAQRPVDTYGTGQDGGPISIITDIDTDLWSSSTHTTCALSGDIAVWEAYTKADSYHHIEESWSVESYIETSDAGVTKWVGLPTIQDADMASVYGDSLAVRVPPPSRPSTTDTDTDVYAVRVYTHILTDTHLWVLDSEISLPGSVTSVAMGDGVLAVAHLDQYQHDNMVDVYRQDPGSQDWAFEATLAPANGYPYQLGAVVAIDPTTNRICCPASWYDPSVYVFDECVGDTCDPASPWVMTEQFQFSGYQYDQITAVSVSGDVVVAALEYSGLGVIALTVGANPGTYLSPPIQHVTDCALDSDDSPNISLLDTLLTVGCPGRLALLTEGGADADGYPLFTEGSETVTYYTDTSSMVHGSVSYVPGTTHPRVLIQVHSCLSVASGEGVLSVDRAILGFQAFGVEITDSTGAEVVPPMCIYSDSDGIPYTSTETFEYHDPELSHFTLYSRDSEMVRYTGLFFDHRDHFPPPLGGQSHSYMGNVYNAGGADASLSIPGGSGGYWLIGVTVQPVSGVDLWTSPVIPTAACILIGTTLSLLGTRLCCRVPPTTNRECTVMADVAPPPGTVSLVLLEFVFLLAAKAMVLVGDYICLCYLLSLVYTDLDMPWDEYMDPLASLSTGIRRGVTLLNGIDVHSGIFWTNGFGDNWVLPLSLALALGGCIVLVYLIHGVLVKKLPTCRTGVRAFLMPLTLLLSCAIRVGGTCLLAALWEWCSSFVLYWYMPLVLIGCLSVLLFLVTAYHGSRNTLSSFFLPILSCMGRRWVQIRAPYASLFTRVKASGCRIWMLESEVHTILCWSILLVPEVYALVLFQCVISDYCTLNDFEIYIAVAVLVLRVLVPIVCLVVTRPRLRHVPVYLFYDIVVAVTASVVLAWQAVLFVFDVLYSLALLTHLLLTPATVCLGVLLRGMLGVYIPLYPHPKSDRGNRTPRFLHLSMVVLVGVWALVTAPYIVRSPVLWVCGGLVCSVVVEYLLRRVPVPNPVPDPLASLSLCVPDEAEGDAALPLSGDTSDVDPLEDGVNRDPDLCPPLASHSPPPFNPLLAQLDAQLTLSHRCLALMLVPFLGPLLALTADRLTAPPLVTPLLRVPHINVNWGCNLVSLLCLVVTVFMYPAGQWTGVPGWAWVCLGTLYLVPQLYDTYTMARRVAGVTRVWGKTARPPVIYHPLSDKQTHCDKKKKEALELEECLPLLGQTGVPTEVVEGETVYHLEGMYGAEGQETTLYQGYNGM
ncbi:hypothetical protein KIPB_000460 [Kipferlia bialata]|uniref:Uncharacterized protein n=1 Tax=Kipferlia bialata TaxID=797122 RepID=A0A9K3CP49_9EUKA|nr:hypothetical protein KIPB_000460 [Kipferlia bialata]|eukprot:g460.t1